MNYLVLNRFALARRPYRDWIGDNHRIVVITDTRSIAATEAEKVRRHAGYDELVVLDDYQQNPLVELEALRLHARYRFDEIIALGEFDLLRAARLRQLLGLPGQSVASAEAFRDKMTMKDHLVASGVPVAPYAAAPSLTSLARFITEHHYPVVVKPRRGGGSQGVVVLHDDDGFRSFVARTPALGNDDGAPLMVERYLEHQLFHVDGIVVDGNPVLVWPSAQEDTSCLDMLVGSPLRSCLLDANDPLLEPLRDMTMRALQALPTPATSLFHAEIFDTAEHGLVFNEVGCRMGGGRIEEMVALGFGTCLPEAYVKALTGVRLPDLPVLPNRIAGLTLFPPRPGHLAAIPDTCPITGVVDYTVRAEVGTRLRTARLSVESIASALAIGTTRTEVSKVLDDLAEWFDRETRIEPATD